jgi:hypothetical protein
MDRLMAPLERFREAIYRQSPAGSVVVLPWVDRKLVAPMYGERQRFYIDRLTPEILDRLLARHGTITFALHERRESAHLRAKAQENLKLLSILTTRAEFDLLYEWGTETAERLRIWRVSASARDNDHR